MNGLKKSAIDRAKELGVVDRMNTLLSAAYLLNSEASLMTARVEALLARHGLLLGRMKQLTNHLNQSFDRYCREFADLILTEDSRKGYMEDVSEFDDFFLAYTSIPKEWHYGEPQNVELEKDVVIRAKKRKAEGKTND